MIEECNKGRRDERQSEEGEQWWMGVKKEEWELAMIEGWNEGRKHGRWREKCRIKWRRRIMKEGMKDQWK